MMIELHGARFVNRGAHLMIAATVQALQTRIPGAEFCMRDGRGFHGGSGVPESPIFAQAPTLSPGAYTRPYRIGMRRGQLRAGVAATLLASDGRARFELVQERDTHAFVDLSGYAFGDVWPLSYSWRAANRARYFSRFGRPVVFLPQMFGPFTNPDHRRAVGSLAQYADQIYARDRLSLQAMETIGPADGKVQLAPDITIACTPRAEDRAGMPEEPYACIIPNVRMLDKGAATWGGIYMEHLNRAVERIQAAKLQPIVVIHESGAKDRELAHGLAAGYDLRVFESPNPLRLKALLGGAHFVLSSRFHALVGALSSGTPAVCLGWAHKYDAIMEDFAATDFCHRADDGMSRFMDRLDRLLDDTERARQAARIRASREAMLPMISRMWDRVADLLNKRRP